MAWLFVVQKVDREVDVRTMDSENPLLHSDNQPAGVGKLKGDDVDCQVSVESKKMDTDELYKNLNVLGNSDNETSVLGNLDRDHGSDDEGQGQKMDTELYKWESDTCEDNLDISSDSEGSDITSDESFNSVNENSSEKRFSCDWCDYKTAERRSLSRHMNTVHPGAVLSCHLCPFKAGHNRMMKTHMDFVHKGIAYSCDRCDFRSSWKKSLSVHVSRVHRRSLLGEAENVESVGRKEGRKDDVQKTTHRSSLDRPTRTVHAGDKFSWQECKFDTVEEAVLKNHIESGHKEIVYRCYACDFVSTWSKSLEKHIKGTHLQISDKALNDATMKGHVDSDDRGILHCCEQCDFRTIYKESLRKHAKHRHTDRLTEVTEEKEKLDEVAKDLVGDDAKKHKCDRCDYKTKLKSTLNRHVRTMHTKEKLKCMMCNFEALHDQKLNNHIDSVHKGIEYSCELCSFKTTWKKSLRVHISRTHE